MSIVNTHDRTITAKIVYYGPGLGGKTTSLKTVYRIIDPDGRAKLISLKTDEERTLFFDFLPIDIGMVSGYKVRLQTFTVPGQVKYNLTRKYVLMGADGVVFVADAQRQRLQDNLTSFENLKDNLAAIGMSLDRLPMVLQYNKQDLPDLIPSTELDALLGHLDVPSFPTSGVTGEGVFQAFVEIASRTVAFVGERYKIRGEEPLGLAICDYFDRFSPTPTRRKSACDPGCASPCDSVPSHTPFQPLGSLRS
jgi:signal recognition particle receptor subunit beta